MNSLITYISAANDIGMDGNTLYVDGSANNVGIGTTTPGNKLDVNGGVVVSPNTAGKNTFELSTHAVDEGRLRIKNGDTTTVQIRAGGETYFNGGNVGIGTTSPGANLHVVGSTRTDRMTLGSVGTAGVGGDYYSIYHETGDWISPYPDLVIQYHTGIKYDAYGAYGGHRFYTGYDGSGNPAGLKLSIDDNVIVHSGNVGIGTTDPKTKLHVNGILRIGYGDFRIVSDENQYLAFRAYPPDENRTVLRPAFKGFRVLTWGGAINLDLADDTGNLWIRGAFIPASDSRTKLNQEELDYGLEEVLALQPKRYLRADYTRDAETGEIEIQQEARDQEKDMGLIAQEVYEIMPEAASKPEDESKQLWGLAYDKLIPVLVKAIQEQQEQIDELKQEIAGLKEQ